MAYLHCQSKVQLTILCTEYSYLNLQCNLLQDISDSVGSLLNLLQLDQIVLLGVGAGANIALNVALEQPSKVLGVIVVQPIVSAPGLLQQVRARSTAADLKTSHTRDTDQFLIQHTFGNFTENTTDQNVKIIQEFREDLHNLINPRYS